MCSRNLNVVHFECASDCKTVLVFAVRHFKTVGRLTAFTPQTTAPASGVFFFRAQKPSFKLNLKEIDRLPLFTLCSTAKHGNTECGLTKLISSSVRYLRYGEKTVEKTAQTHLTRSAALGRLSLLGVDLPNSPKRLFDEKPQKTGFTSPFPALR